MGRARDAAPADHAGRLRSSLKRLRDRFGRMRLSDIAPADVARVRHRAAARRLQGLDDQGPALRALRLSTSTRAATSGFAGTSPLTLLERQEKPDTEDERPKRVLTPDELARLLAAVDEPYRTIFELAAETGARLGETLGLVWGEIDFDGATVTFTHQLDRNGRRVRAEDQALAQVHRDHPCAGVQAALPPARGRSLRRPRLRVHDP